MMRLIEAAEGRPVSLDELKRQCHIELDDTDFDDELTIYLDAACEFVADRVSLVLAPQTYRIDRRDWWGGDLEILLAPVRDVSEVAYFDGEGTRSVLADDEYRWYRTDRGARLEIASGFHGPLLADRADAVQVTVEAGFEDPDATGAGDDPELHLPVKAKQAILLIAAYWNENREAAATDAPKAIPLAAESLMAQMRVYR